MLGAYLFGGVTILQLHAQGFGVAIPSQFLSMLPYLATILVLVLISRDQTKLRENSPASLGRVFRPPA
jgi:simple sugar transport system permease protein